MSKAAEAFRTISEVADELEVHKHVLRFWENRFPQIKPMKRGGGRRYYRPADLELLRGIRHLLHNEGYTIKGVQKILREHGVEAVKSSTQQSLGAGTSRPATASSVPSPAAGRTGRRGLAAVVAIAPVVPAARSARGAAGRAVSAPRDRKAAIAMMIHELEAARDILSGKPISRTKASAQPGPRARARR